MDFKSPALDRLVAELQKLPGIGSKTAERLAHREHTLLQPGTFLRAPERVDAGTDDIDIAHAAFSVIGANANVVRRSPLSSMKGSATSRIFMSIAKPSSGAPN